MEAIISEYITCVIEAVMTMVFCLLVTRVSLRKRLPVLALMVAGHKETKNHRHDRLDYTSDIFRNDSFHPHPSIRLRCV